MDTEKRNLLLDLLDYPAFLVKDGVIIQANKYALQKSIKAGRRISELLGAAASVYDAFSGDCMYLKLNIPGRTPGATVTVLEDMHLFCMERTRPDEDSDETLALPRLAMYLRRPLHALLCAEEERPHNEEVRRNLFQIQRILTNMADYPRYQDGYDIIYECTDLFWFFGELVDKAAALVEKTGVHIEYTALPHCIHAMIDREMLERAIYNLISNAVKFSPPNGIVRIKLTLHDNMACFTIQDQGPGIDRANIGTMFSKYRRGPDIEDGRCGAGLGMALVKTAADAHDGTVLVDHPSEGGARVTFAITIKEADTGILRSPVTLPKRDMISGFDRALVELCDVLPPDVFK